MFDSRFSFFLSGTFGDGTQYRNTVPQLVPSFSGRFGFRPAHFQAKAISRYGCLAVFA
jgi:hypothetical protein